MDFPFKFMLIFLQLYSFASSQQYKYITIGGIFPENSDDLANSLQNAVNNVNRYSELVKLQVISVNVDTKDSFEVQKAVCNLINDNRVAAIIGPSDVKSAALVASVCKKLQIPHFVSFFQPIELDNFNSTDSFTRNIFPQAKMYSNALLEIVQSLRCKKVAIIYDLEENLPKLEATFTYYSQFDVRGKKSVTFHKLPSDSTDYKTQLKSILMADFNQVIIDCTPEKTLSLLKQGTTLGMMSEYWSYLLIGNDAHTLDLAVLPNVRANITTIRLINSENTIFYDYDSAPNFIRDRYRKPSFNADKMTTEAALSYDSTNVIFKAFNDNATFINQFRMKQTDCYADVDDQYFSSGRDLLDQFDDKMFPEGLTDDIHFDTDGMRDLFYIEILQLSLNDGTSDGTYKKIATYDTRDGIRLLRNFTSLEEETTATMETKEFKVIMREGMPFLRKKLDAVIGSNVTETDLYEGFAIDLIERIARECRFKYRIIVKDKDLENGIENPATGQWTGIIGEIQSKKADLAIGDITVTYSRKTAIDFSTPFMTLGISILFGKPKEDQAGFFSFIDPLSAHVWLHTATAFLCISIVEFLLAKMAAKDWENPHPCDEDPEELENIWNMHNCFWLTVGSIMQQGCDILPKGVPTRLAVAAWWFFTLIITSSYTANMAAFLTKVQMEESFKNVEDLASQKQIQYGLQKRGSTEAFFRHSNYSTYKKMWQVMDEAVPPVTVNNNAEGVKRVRDSNGMYAYFMESAPLKYIIHSDCNLTQVGGLLDSKEYAIGMPSNSPYRMKISEAILRLQEDGQIEGLRVKWWETNNLDKDGNQANCDAGKKEDNGPDELGMDNVGGVFLVLGVGVGISIIVGILEFIWCVRKTSIEEKITPGEAFKKELKFAVSVWEMRKPCALSSSAGSSVDSSISDEEDIEEIRLNSIKSAKQNKLNGY